ncbi:CvpA family protein [Sphingomicrobium sp. XHP0239]|uniref:CvpA family protein n=1 Tax=Sphingomicrobium maritimum TaxID=3133972 RepID=UPI0031CC78E9
MTALDVLIILILAGGALLGFVRGFVQEVFSLLAWVAGIVAVKMGHGRVTELLLTQMERETAAIALALVLLFVPVYLAVRWLALRLGRRTRRSIINPVDRLLGGLFGLLKGLLGATILFLIANLAVDSVYGEEAERPPWMAEARTYALLNASARATVDLVEARREGRL